MEGFQHQFHFCVHLYSRQLLYWFCHYYWGLMEYGVLILQRRYLRLLYHSHFFLLTGKNTIICKYYCGKDRIYKDLLRLLYIFRRMPRLPDSSFPCSFHTPIEYKSWLIVPSPVNGPAMVLLFSIVKCRLDLLCQIEENMYLWYNFLVLRKEDLYAT